MKSLLSELFFKCSDNAQLRRTALRHCLPSLACAVLCYRSCSGHTSDFLMKPGLVHSEECSVVCPGVSGKPACVPGTRQGVGMWRPLPLGIAFSVSSYVPPSTCPLTPWSHAVQRADGSDPSEESASLLPGNL